MEGVNDAPIGRNTESRLFYRFRELKAMGIVGSWPTLLRWIAAGTFPPGVWLGPNVRAWAKADIDAWIASRPSTKAVA
jgi:predicted DNA-binding transcriptional regulator AlpA